MGVFLVVKQSGIEPSLRDIGSGKSGQRFGSYEMRRGVNLRRCQKGRPRGDDKNGAEGRRLGVRDENLKLAVGLDDVVQRVQNLR